jgi:hypothetical protein
VDLKQLQVGDEMQNFVKLSEVSKQKRSTIFLGSRGTAFVMMPQIFNQASVQYFYRMVALLSNAENN